MCLDDRAERAHDGIAPWPGRLGPQPAGVQRDEIRGDPMTTHPPDALVSIRRGEALLRWVLAGPVIGLVTGALFGVGYVIVTESLGAFWFGGFMGANFGLSVGVPFGIVLGIFNALLPSPSRVQHLILTARIAGAVLVMAAGIALATVADDIFVLAAVLGAAGGWAATPTVVWSSVEPLTTAPRPGTTMTSGGTAR